MKENKIIIILGPTSTGKTSLALDLCKKSGGEIISADSRQVYKYMDIGTGKIPINSDLDIVRSDAKWVLDGVNIWGYDLITPDKYFSAYDYARFALGKAEEIQGEGKNIFLVGGTGFYVDVLSGRKKLAGLKPDFELRKSLSTTPTKNLFTWLTSLNPRRANELDRKNRVRIIRALEIEISKEKSNTAPLPHLKNTKFVFLGLTANRKFLYKKTDNWIEVIWEHGLIDEVRYLLSLGYRNSPRLSGLVYKSVVSYLDEDLTMHSAKEQVKFDLHAYVRRQQTYFKRNKNVLWFDITQDSFEQSVYNFVSKLNLPKNG